MMEVFRHLLDTDNFSKESCHFFFEHIIKNDPIVKKKNR